jgi:predicted phosphodiesterase
VRLWVMSDLHLELTQGWELPPPAERPAFDVMVVAGDLVPGMQRGVRWLLDRVTDRPVIYIAGNHEAYSGDLDRTVEKAREAARGTNVVVMNDDTIEIGGVLFIASTLWTDFNLFGSPAIAMELAGGAMNDYRRIRHQNYARRLRPVDTLARHRASRRFIEAQLAAPFAGARVVVTHHAPYLGGARPGTEKDLLSAAYASDLTALFGTDSGGGPSAQADEARLVWIYGHTHRSDDSLVGKTRLVSNAKGYGPGYGSATWDNPMFNPQLVIEV